MRKPLARKSKPTLPVGVIVSRPAPVKGWNAKDSLASMKPGEAVELSNFFPLPAEVELRSGYAEHVVDAGWTVETLMSYSASNGTQEQYAITGGEIYEVTAHGSPAAAVVTGLTNSRFEHINFTNSSGVSYLCCFNGVDNPRYYNGSAWIEITAVSTPAITGVTTTSLKCPNVHKRRIWLIEEGTLKAWWLPVDAVGGAANALDLSGIAKRGGNLVALATWTLDAGEGLDDHWVAVTSEGEVIVYEGTDPSSGSTWQIKGVWHIGEPVQTRCVCKFGGDVLLLLANGLFPMSRSLLSADIKKSAALSENIQSVMNAATKQYNGTFGWGMTLYPAKTMLVVNIPKTPSEQYVMNTQTGAWAKFTGLNAKCFNVFAGDLYFGGAGGVYKYAGTSDNGANIVGYAMTAYDYFGSSKKKSWKMARPIIKSNGRPTVGIGMAVDFASGDNLGTLSFTPPDSGLWGIGKWGVAKWGSGPVTQKEWAGVAGVGNSAATRFKVSSNALAVSWLAIDYLVETGNLI